mgnify:CR=1 FL=1
MLDKKLLNKSPELVKKNLSSRGYVLNIDQWKKLEEERKIAQVNLETNQENLNKLSKVRLTLIALLLCSVSSGEIKI